MSPRVEHLLGRLPLVLVLSLPWLCTACTLTSPGGPEPDVPTSDLANSSGDARALAAPEKQGGFFPLDFGDRWQQETVATFVVVPNVGEPGTPDTMRTKTQTEVTGTEILSGTSYTLLEQRWTQGTVHGTYWFRYRQDRMGLYEADVSIVQPPSSGLRVLTSTEAREAPREASAWETQASREAQRERLAAQLHQRGVHPGFVRALDQALARHAMIREVASTVRFGAERGATSKASPTGGPLAQELTRLRYPLHPGASWIVLDDPRVTAMVEARETLAFRDRRLTSWRIRIDWPGVFGPRDVAHVWYGRCGELQLVAHLEGVATDENGDPVGLLISDESTVLVGLDLTRGGCH